MTEEQLRKLDEDTANRIGWLMLTPVRQRMAVVIKQRYFCRPPGQVITEEEIESCLNEVFDDLFVGDRAFAYTSFEQELKFQILGRSLPITNKWAQKLHFGREF